MNKWLKVRGLARWERWILIQSLVALPVTALALQFVGVRRWQSAMGGRRRDKSVRSSTVLNQTDQAHRIATLVSLASRHGIYRGTCLHQSLVLWWLLKAREIESDIRFGARKDHSKLAAHAWVESEGIVLNDSDGVSDRFSPFKRAFSS